MGDGDLIHFAKEIDINAAHAAVYGRENLVCDSLDWPVLLRELDRLDLGYRQCARKTERSVALGCFSIKKGR